jgi:hypothetical protein
VAIRNFIIQTFFLSRSRITTSDSVVNAYLLRSDAILGIQARWINYVSSKEMMSF